MMPASMSFISVLILIGSAQGLFLAVALVMIRRGNRRANRILSSLALVLSILLVDGFMNVTNSYSRYPQLIGAAWPICFLVGPLLYFYIRELSSSKRIVFSVSQFFHFTPSIISALLLVLYSRMNMDEHVPSLITPLIGIRLPVLKAVPLLANLVMTVYMVLSFLQIRKYNSGIKQSFSSLEKISLSWIRTLLLSFVCLYMGFNLLTRIVPALGFNNKTENLGYLGMAVVTYTMAFKALLRPEIFSQIETANRTELLRTDQSIVLDLPSPAPDIQQNGNGILQKKKYRKSSLTNERSAKITGQLRQLMEEERFFLEPELTLPQLAERLSVSTNDLSQAINREINKSFFDFVNEYRVQEAKKLLSSPKHGHLSILGIALDAGFNSKSAFYSAFSKHIGTTPSGFRKQSALLEQRAESNVQGNA